MGCQKQLRWGVKQRARTAYASPCISSPDRRSSCAEGCVSSDDLALLGTLGSVLPALKELCLWEPAAAGPDGVQRLAEKLGAGALPAVTLLSLSGTHVGSARPLPPTWVVRAASCGHTLGARSRAARAVTWCAMRTATR